MANEAASDSGSQFLCCFDIIIIFPFFFSCYYKCTEKRIHIVVHINHILICIFHSFINLYIC